MKLSVITLIGAIVLFVFAVIASAVASGTCLGVTYATWVAAGLLALAVTFLLDRVVPVTA